MPLKSTHQNFSSVNFIPSSSSEKTHFFTTDKNGAFSIFEKTAIKSTTIKTAPFKFQKQSSSCQAINSQFGGHNNFGFSSSSKNSGNGNLRIFKVFDSRRRNSNSSIYNNSNKLNTDGKFLKTTRQNEKIQTQESQEKDLGKITASTVVDSETVILCGESQLHIYKLNYNSGLNEFDPVNAIDIEVGRGDNQKSEISCISRDRTGFNKSYLADSQGQIYILDIQSSKLTPFYSNSCPISSIISLDESGTIFATSDFGGKLVIYDSRSKTQILKHKCGCAPALLSLAKTNFAFNSQSVLACGAENGQVYLYDLKAQKACKSSIFDRNEPFPIFDVCFNQNKPDTLYTASLFNLTEIRSNREDETGQKFWFHKEEANLPNTSMESANKQTNSSLSTLRSSIYSSEHSNFISLDCDNWGNLVAVSDNGLIYCL